MENINQTRSRNANGRYMDDCMANVKFFVVDRDVSQFNHMYVNSTDVSDEDAQAVSNLAYDAEGNKVITMQDEFPTQAVLDGAKVITCGFLP